MSIIRAGRYHKVGRKITVRRANEMKALKRGKKK